MTIFEDFLTKGDLYLMLEKEGLICKAFQEKHIKSLYEYGWYDELYDNIEPNFKELEQLPIYVVLLDEYKEDITGELEFIRKLELLDDGKLGLEKKSVTKKTLGHSPDFADSLAMRMHFILNPIKQYIYQAFSI